MFNINTPIAAIFFAYIAKGIPMTRDEAGNDVISLSDQTAGEFVYDLVLTKRQKGI